MSPADPERIAPDELAPWLAHIADREGVLAEGALADALDVDRDAARLFIQRGAEVAKRVRAARADRLRGEAEAVARRDAEERARVAEAINAPREARRAPHGKALDEVRALLSDGRPRSLTEIAAVLGITKTAASRRLYRAGCVLASSGRWTETRTSVPCSACGAAVWVSAPQGAGAPPCTAVCSNACAEKEEREKAALRST